MDSIQRLVPRGNEPKNEAEESVGELLTFELQVAGVGMGTLLMSPNSRAYLTVPAEPDARTLSRFKCDYCGFRSNDYTSAVAHLSVHTGKDPYQCRYCDKTAKFRSNIAHHLITTHNRKSTGDILKLYEYKSQNGVMKVVDENHSATTTAEGQPTQTTPAALQTDFRIGITRISTSFNTGCHMNLRDIASNGINTEFLHEVPCVDMALRNLRSVASIR